MPKKPDDHKPRARPPGRKAPAASGAGAHRDPKRPSRPFKREDDRSEKPDRDGQRPARAARPFKRNDDRSPRQDRDGQRPPQASRPFKRDDDRGRQPDREGQRPARTSRPFKRDDDRSRQPDRERQRPARPFVDRDERKRPAFAKRAGADRPPHRQRDSEPAAPDNDENRIAKVIARAGLCSRRDAEAWIAEGRVSLDGRPVTSPALNVRPDSRIEVDGKPLAARARTRLFLFHKPRGLVTTDRDPEGRRTVFEHLRQNWPQGPRVMSIGRLDINTEGLLLLTNDGGLARVLELPATGWLRRYKVRANGTTDQAALDGLAKGVTIEGIHYAGIEAVLDRIQGANCWLTLGLREGKNREVKRVLEALGLGVNRLIRLSFGPFQLGHLAEGAVEEVPTRVLREQLGASLAAEAGADFTSPVEAVAAIPAPSGGRDEQRKEPRAPDAPRRHVSALRAQAAKDAKGDRRRTERAETADRKGRRVAVERVSKVAPGRDEAAPTSRNGRRFRSEQQGKKPFRDKRPDNAAPRVGARPGRPGPSGPPNGKPRRPPR